MERGGGGGGGGERGEGLARGKAERRKIHELPGRALVFLGRAFSLRLLAGDSRGRRALILALPVQQALR